MPHLFEPFKLRDIVFPNRIGMPPMCQYCGKDGMALDWHFVHYGSRAVGGAGLMVLEAASVAPAGRLSLGDLGVWDDSQIAPLARIAAFSREQGCVPGIQIAHAGRKAAVGRGWDPHRAMTLEEGGWTVSGPSTVPFSDVYNVPGEMTVADLRQVVADFAAGARRALAAGFQVLNLHGAHGYLLHSFLSPLSNRRTDDYGGTFDNRTRLFREVVTAVRAEWPQQLPLMVRVSATDWVEGGWTPDDTVALCHQLKALGVDLIDVSSGGSSPAAAIPAGPGFQTGFAERIRREVGMPVAAVGLITTPEQADHVVRSGQADLVFVGREILRDPYWPLHAAKALGQATTWPPQYLRAAPAGTKAR
jgi:2,4-dienoyl-CoA reductase-like NADH-dependent reductase (Old Yellow Enzyme family)